MSQKFSLFVLMVFILAFMLERTRAFTSIGSAFGLLAAFSLLRFRTRTITAKDMTYLFIIMTIGLINSVMKGSVIEIAILNCKEIDTFIAFGVLTNIIFSENKSVWFPLFHRPKTALLFQVRI